MSKDTISSQSGVARVGKYVMLDLLGEGAFGKVRLAIHESSGKEYAIKIMDKSHIKANELTLQVRREIAVMKAMTHPNIVNLHEVLTSSKNLYMVMDLVTGGELFDAVAESGRLSEARTRSYFQQLVDGVCYCHSRRVYHRDLKPENLLLSGDKQTLKITDFGLSSIKAENASSELLHTVMGSPHYIAPEIITSAAEGYDGAKVDVWACGVILYGMLAGQLPFDEHHTRDLYRAIVHNIVSFPPHFSYDVIKLLRAMLQKDPYRRPTMEQVKMFTWFKVDYEPAVTHEGVKKSRPKLRKRSERGKKRKDGEKQAEVDQREVVEDKPISELFREPSRNSSLSSGGKSLIKMVTTPRNKTSHSVDQENIDPRKLFAGYEDEHEDKKSDERAPTTAGESNSNGNASYRQEDSDQLDTDSQKTNSSGMLKIEKSELAQKVPSKDKTLPSAGPIKPRVAFLPVVSPKDASDGAAAKNETAFEPLPPVTPQHTPRVANEENEHEITQSPLTPQVSRFSSVVSSVASGPEERHHESLGSHQEGMETKGDTLSDFISPVSERSDVFPSPKENTKPVAFASLDCKLMSPNPFVSDDSTQTAEARVQPSSAKADPEVESKVNETLNASSKGIVEELGSEGTETVNIFKPMPSMFKSLTEDESITELSSLAPSVLCPDYDYDSDGVPQWCLDSMEVFADVDDDSSVEQIHTSSFKRLSQNLPMQKKPDSIEDASQHNSAKPRPIFAPLDSDIAQKLSPASGEEGQAENSFQEVDVK